MLSFPPSQTGWLYKPTEKHTHHCDATIGISISASSKWWLRWSYAFPCARLALLCPRSSNSPTDTVCRKLFQKRVKCSSKSPPNAVQLPHCLYVAYQNRYPFYVMCIFKDLCSVCIYMYVYIELSLPIVFLSSFLMVRTDLMERKMFFVMGLFLK